MRAALTMLFTVVKKQTKAFYLSPVIISSHPHDNLQTIIRRF